MPDDLPGSIVADPTGRRYGRLDEVFAGRTSGAPEFGIVSLDAEGTERVAVPLDGARRDEAGSLVLPLDVERVVAAPRVQGDVDEIPAEAGRLIRAHFGLGDAPTAVMPAQDEVGVVVSEEQLSVETQSVPTDRVRVRKAVVTEDVTLTVTLRREELVIERDPIDAASPLAESDRPLVTEGEEIEFILHAEEPVVSKRVVPVERVRLRRDEIVEERRITDTVRKERVEVDETPISQERSP